MKTTVALFALLVPTAALAEESVTSIINTSINAGTVITTTIHTNRTAEKINKTNAETAADMNADNNKTIRHANETWAGVAHDQQATTRHISDNQTALEALRIAAQRGGSGWANARGGNINVVWKGGKGPMPATRQQ